MRTWLIPVAWVRLGQDCVNKTVSPRLCYKPCSRSAMRSAKSILATVGHNASSPLTNMSSSRRDMLPQCIGFVVFWFVYIWKPCAPNLALCKQMNKTPLYPTSAASDWDDYSETSQESLYTFTKTLPRGGEFQRSQLFTFFQKLILEPPWRLQHRTK